MGVASIPAGAMTLMNFEAAAAQLRGVPDDFTGEVTITVADGVAEKMKQVSESCFQIGEGDGVPQRQRSSERRIGTADEDVSLVDTAGAAKMLGASPATLTTWRSRKRGPRYVKVGALVKYRGCDIEAYLREFSTDKAGG